MLSQNSRSSVGGSVPRTDAMSILFITLACGWLIGRSLQTALSPSPAMTLVEKVLQ